MLGLLYMRKESEAGPSGRSGDVCVSVRGGTVDVMREEDVDILCLSVLVSQTFIQRENIWFLSQISWNIEKQDVGMLTFIPIGE